MKKLPLILVCGIAMSAHFVPAQANGLDKTFGRVNKTFHGWEVRTSINPMTDKKTCVALMRGNSRIQASPNMLAISFQKKGGVRGYEYRLDDGPVSVPQVATTTEMKIGAVMLKEPIFTEVLSSQRLRIQVIPIVGTGLQFEDINTKGLADAVKHMRALCK